MHLASVSRLQSFRGADQIVKGLISVLFQFDTSQDFPQIRLVLDNIQHFIRNNGWINVPVRV